jgi:hypothetical protein
MARLPPEARAPQACMPESFCYMRRAFSGFPRWRAAKRNDGKERASLFEAVPFSCDFRFADFQIAPFERNDARGAGRTLREAKLPKLRGRTRVRLLFADRLCERDIDQPEAAP